MNDTLVRCDKRDGHGCGRVERVAFGSALRDGWPKCHGYTMRLVRTTADIAATTTRVLQDQTGRVR